MALDTVERSATPRVITILPGGTVKSAPYVVRKRSFCLAMSVLISASVLSSCVWVILACSCVVSGGHCPMVVWLLRKSPSRAPSLKPDPLANCQSEQEPLKSISPVRLARRRQPRTRVLSILVARARTQRVLKQMSRSGVSRLREPRRDHEDRIRRDPYSQRSRPVRAETRKRDEDFAMNRAELHEQRAGLMKLEKGQIRKRTST